jgi:hypothetical protein
MLLPVHKITKRARIRAFLQFSKLFAILHTLDDTKDGTSRQQERLQELHFRDKVAVSLTGIPSPEIYIVVLIISLINQTRQDTECLHHILIMQSWKAHNPLLHINED